jgi:hypothetical protein
MTTQDPLWHPQQIIGKHWHEDQSREQAQILSLARDALDFVSDTGQQYNFEDFRKGPRVRATPTAGAPPTTPRESAALEERLRKTEAFFTRLRNESDSAKERGLIQIILDTLQFISSTDQHDALRNFIESVESNAPPYAVAAFDTREEAEAWLGSHPSPPHLANVLIANDYHTVIYDRATNLRRLPHGSTLNEYLADLKEMEHPVATASFATQEEADAWLRAQPTPARRAWVLIGGALYLAAYHPNIDHRALYPHSIAFVRSIDQLE